MLPHTSLRTPLVHTDTKPGYLLLTSADLALQELQNQKS